MWTQELVTGLQNIPKKVRQPAVAVVGKGRGVVHIEDLDDEDDEEQVKQLKDEVKNEL